MTLNIKDKKNYFDESVFQTNLYNEKVRITWVFLWIKDPDSVPVFSRKDQIRPDPDPKGVFVHYTQHFIR